MKRLNVLLADTAGDIHALRAAECRKEQEETRTMLFCGTPQTPLIACQEQILQAVEAAQKQEDYDLIVFSGGTADLFAVRTAVRCDGSALTRAGIRTAAGGKVTAERGAFSYNLRAVLEMSRRPCCVSTQPENKDDSCETEEAAEPYVQPAADGGIRLVSAKERSGEDPLRNADLVFIAGRGIGSRAGFERMENAALALNGSAGATRPVAADGWADLRKVIGISGKQISPKVCVVFGASGTMPFMMGIGKSGTIIAVNTDADASIFRTCDIGIVADWKDVLERIEERISK